MVEKNVEIFFLSSQSVGEFAEVFKGLFEDSIVAVKILKVCECVDYCCSLICFGFDAYDTFDLFLEVMKQSCENQRTDCENVSALTTNNDLICRVL